MPSDPASAKPQTRMERLQAFFMRYGVLGVVVNYVIFGLCMVVFFVLIRAGIHHTSNDTEAMGSVWGTLGAAYVACKIIQIPRLSVVFFITPLIARIPFIARYLDAMNQKKKP